MGRWDLCLKLLLRESPQDFVTWLLPGARFICWREGQFQKRGRSKKGSLMQEIRADSVMEVEYLGQRLLIHVEFQSTKDEEMGYRLLGYSHAALGLHKLQVSSYVIYVLHVFEPPDTPYLWTVTGLGERMRFKYDSIELAEMPLEELEQKQLVGIAPLLLLTKGGASREVLERVIAVLTNARKLEVLAILEILATLVFEDDPAMLAWVEWRFESMHDFLIENTSLYKRLVKEGEIKGFEKGEIKGEIKGFEKGLRQSIEAVVQARFPDLLDIARARVKRIHGEEQLREILLKLITLSDELEIYRFLTSLRKESA